MKKEAVQQGRNPNASSTSGSNSNSSLQNIKFAKKSSPPIFYPPLTSNSGETKLFFPYKSEESLQEIVEKFMEKIFEQNISIPFFSSLNQNDQIVLLKNAWSELFFIYLSQSGYPMENLNLDVTESASIAIDLKNKIIKTLQSQVTKLRQFCLEPEEFSFLKGIVLFNSGKSYSQPKKSILVPKYKNFFQN